MLTHKGTQTIETARLLLRPFHPQDAQAMFDNWASDPEVTTYLTWPPHANVGVTAQILACWEQQAQSPTCYQWAIVLKDLAEPIGSISVVSQDEQVESAHIGYCIGRAWWHQGITTEALHAVIDFLFDEVGFRRIDSRHDIRNPHSGAVMAKCGMRYEGTHRQSDRNNQGLCDTAWYGILAEDRAKANA